MTTGLFKYFPPDEDKLNFFVKRQVLLTPPQYFNDPWDFLVRAVPYTDAELEDRARELNLPAQLLKRISMKADFIPEESVDYQKQMSKRIGVVCLSENPLEGIMWAYYGESHGGFVAEFRHGQETEEEGIRIRLGPFGPAGKVSYLPQFPHSKRDVSNIAKVLWTKHSDWDHEREWRVVQPLVKAAPGKTKVGGWRSLLKFEPDYLTRVILGLRVSPLVKETLTEMLAQPEFRHVRMDEIIIDPTSNELDFRETQK